jgi:hypothetical protein
MAFTWGGKLAPTPVRLKQKKFKAVEVGKGSAWGNKSEEKAAPIVSQRMAGEEIPEGLDALIAGIKDEGKEERLELAVQDARAYLDRQYGIDEPNNRDTSVVTNGQ